MALFLSKFIIKKSFFCTIIILLSLIGCQDNKFEKTNNSKQPNGITGPHAADTSKQKPLTDAEIEDSKKKINRAVTEFLATNDLDKIKSTAYLNGLSDYDITFIRNYLDQFVGTKPVQFQYHDYIETDRDRRIIEHGIRTTLKPIYQLIVRLIENDGKEFPRQLILRIGQIDGRLMITFSNTIAPPQVSKETELF